MKDALDLLTILKKYIPDKISQLSEIEIIHLLIQNHFIQLQNPDSSNLSKSLKTTTFSFKNSNTLNSSKTDNSGNETSPEFQEGLSNATRDNEIEYAHYLALGNLFSSLEHEKFAEILEIFQRNEQIFDSGFNSSQANSSSFKDLIARIKITFGQYANKRKKKWSSQNFGSNLKCFVDLTEELNQVKDLFATNEIFDLLNFALYQCFAFPNNLKLIFDNNKIAGEFMTILSQENNWRQCERLFTLLQTSFLVYPPKMYILLEKLNKALTELFEPQENKQLKFQIIFNFLQKTELFLAFNENAVKLLEFISQHFSDVFTIPKTLLEQIRKNSALFSQKTVYVHDKQPKISNFVTTNSEMMKLCVEIMQDRSIAENDKINYISKMHKFHTDVYQKVCGNFWAC
ncbi:MAG: hypothetical protein MHPSP_001116 [Paramarteilia canceri]